MNQKQLFLMLIACVAIIAIGLGLVTSFGLSTSNVLFLGILILCPLSHFVMMRNMKHESTHSQQEQNNPNEEKSHVQNCH